MKKIIIIGGGISGLCSAYFLLKEGCDVTVIDREDIISNGASFINAGCIVPSHFIPLAAPGMITKALKWMFVSSSPFYIKPRWDFDFIKWALEFKKSATKQRLESSIPILKELNLKSRDLYENILASSDFDFHYERKGLLMVYSSHKIEKEELIIANRAEKEGLRVKYLNRKDLKTVEPVFSYHVLGGIHYECDGHTTPNLFMKHLRKWLKDNGANFRLNESVTGFKTLENKIVTLETNKGIFEGTDIVLSAGSWTL